MTQQQISFFVTVKKGRPDKSLIPQNTPPAVGPNFINLVYKTDGDVLGPRTEQPAFFRTDNRLFEKDKVVVSTLLSFNQILLNYI